MSELRVAVRFSPFLGGRYRSDGPWSGEEFREGVLLPELAKCLHSSDVLHVNFDGVSGTPTSFLEEAFGGILRARPEWSLDEIQSAMQIEAPRTPGLSPFMELARQYMVRAARRRAD